MARQNYQSGTPWEPLAGYSRAVKAGSRVWVSGTTATDENGTLVAVGDATGQTRRALENLSAALDIAGATLADAVLETR